jgi:hypothetical protein
MDEGVSADEASLPPPPRRGSMEGPWGLAPSMATLEDMLRKSPDMGISLRGGPFPVEGNLVHGGGGVSYTEDFDR